MSARLLEFREALEREPRILASTMKAYLGDVTRFVMWFGVQEGFDPDPATLTYIDVAEWRNHLLARGRSAATVNRSLNALQRWMRWAGNEDANQVRHVEQSARLSPKALERRELRAVLRAAKKGRHTARNIAILQLMMQAGLRVGEVAGLGMGNLTLNGRSGSVRVVGKGKKQRDVPLNVAVRKALQEWLVVRGWGDGTVFVSQKGGALSVRAIQDVVRVLMLAAGVGGSAHSLRHTFAREYLRANENDLVGLGRLLGHKNLNTTAVYTQPTEAELASRTERLAIAG